MNSKGNLYGKINFTKRVVTIGVEFSSGAGNGTDINVNESVFREYNYTFEDIIGGVALNGLFNELGEIAPKALSELISSLKNVFT